MPELPEVETIVENLKREIIGKKIISFWTNTSKIIKNASLKKFQEEILGLKILDIQRRAKNIFICFSEDKILLIHQKMTGHLLYGKWKIEKNEPTSLLKGPLEEKNNQYIRVVFGLNNGRQLALSDLRKFAKLFLGTEKEILNLPEIKELGPEPLEKNFDLKKFKEIFLGKKGKIKQVLMEPKNIAGIGNIYSDEILWAAKINPFAIANKLKEEEWKKIFKYLKKILQKAIKERGSSVGDYRSSDGKKGRYQNFHKVYRKEGKPCSRCGEKIKREKIAGRSTCFCPQCQKI